MIETSAKVRSFPSASDYFSLLSFVLIFVLMAVGCGEGESGNSTSAPGSSLSASDAASAGTGSGEITVNMTGKVGDYKYDPDEMTFSVGQTVKFSLVGNDDTHTFTIEDLNIDEFLDSNQTKSISVAFKTAGTFELTCIPHPEMKGKIVVQ